MESVTAAGPDILHLVEIIKDRLFFMVATKTKHLKSNRKTYFLNVDNELKYCNYYYDFGPLNLSCLYKYCCKLNALLQSTSYQRIIHYTSPMYDTKANSAFLVGCFCILYLNMSPKDIVRLYIANKIKFKPFLDASQNGSAWTINLIDCFAGVVKASSLGFFDFNDFDVDEYDFYNMLQNGDLNWLVPRKFLAFIGPTELDLPNYHPPQFYINYFLKNGIKTVVRLNTACYDSEAFTAAGIEHFDLFFPDGSTPSKAILVSFLKIVERAPGAVAVHCKAGLGRTGSLIAAYIIKHYQFTAREAVAWLRVCRPGSVIAQQQGWLERVEGWLWRQGASYRLEHYGNCDRVLHHKFGIYSRQWFRERETIVKMCRHKDIVVNAENSPKCVRCSAGRGAARSPVNVYNFQPAVSDPDKRAVGQFPEQVYDRRLPGANSSSQGDRLNQIKMSKNGAGAACTESGGGGQGALGPARTHHALARKLDKHNKMRKSAAREKYY